MKNTPVKVKMYQVTPGWGVKDLKVTAKNCVVVGKTTYTNGRLRGPLFETPEAAIDSRLADVQQQIGLATEEIQELKEEVRLLKGMRKEV